MRTISIVCLGTLLGLTMHSFDRNIDQLSQLVLSYVSVEGICLPSEYYYKSLPLAIIDAVFSIGVTYKSTTNTVFRFCERQKPRWARFRDEVGMERTVEDFLVAVGNISPSDLAVNVYGNKQRTSAVNGILKAEAATRWAVILLKFGVNTLADTWKLRNNFQLENELRSLPGQKSGISLNYFKMLIGDENEIKADRHINRFMKKVGLHDVATLKEIAANIHVTPRLLDYAIWQKMNQRSVIPA